MLIFKGREWVRIMNELQLVRFATSFKMIYQKPLESRWLKVNIDGASKGNSGCSSIVFCIRDQHGNLVAA